jgi:hypothetical protein
MVLVRMSPSLPEQLVVVAAGQAQATGAIELSSGHGDLPLFSNDDLNIPPVASYCQVVK